MSNSNSIERLIDYTQTIKPYRTKIVEVLTNFTYEENVAAKIVDKLEAKELPCVCDPNELPPNVGWDTQPYSQFLWVLLPGKDPRGNPMYGVIEDEDNSMYDYPHEGKPRDPDECCEGCDVWLVPGFGWDTQPFSLYATAETNLVDKDGNKIYDTLDVDDNVYFDYPFDHLPEE